jgi:signal transduction histidine kinase
VSLLTDSRFRALRQGDHVCAIYDHPDEQIEGIVDYIKTGLTLGERCVYIVSDRTTQDVHERLTRARVDVGAALDSGRLSLQTKHETYLRGGSFDPDRMIEFLRESEEAALREGCSGLRLTGEMSWALGSEAGCERVVEYETRLNGYFQDSRSHAICQYNRSRFSPDVIVDMLRAHPIAIIDQAACLNPYYEPPYVAGSAAFGERVDWMISRLRKSRDIELETQAAMRERDDFLSVAAQELRTPLQGLNLSLYLAAGQVESDQPAHKSISHAQSQVERLNRLVAIVLDASRLRGSDAEWSFESLDLLQIARITAAFFELEAQQLGFTIQVSGKSVWGIWDAERIGQVLLNLLSNAIRFGGGKPVEITVGAQDGWAEIAVIDHGAGFKPEQKPRLFEHLGYDTSTQNDGRMGLGLWIVHKLVTAMYGAVQVRSEPGHGTCILVRLPLALE